MLSWSWLPPCGDNKAVHVVTINILTFMEILNCFFICRLLKVFVGLSFPYEGPAPLEALANGCAFLNPRLHPPQSSLNTEFFKGKPNIREVRGPHHDLINKTLLHV